MGLKIFFTKNQFLKYSCNIGSTKRNLSRDNSYYLVGLYYNTSIINMNIQVFKLKKNLNFLISVCKKSLNSRPFIVNTTDNIFLNTLYKKNYIKNNISYFVGTWWNGLLKNFKIYYKKHYKKITKKIKKNKRTNFKFVGGKFVNYCLYLNAQNYFDYNSESAYNFYKEVNDISLFTMFLVNAEKKNIKVPGSNLCNTKSYINNFFFNKFYLSICRRTGFLSKKKFIYFVIKKWNIFKISKRYLYLYYDFIKCFLIKKKNKALCILKDDLN